MTTRQPPSIRPPNLEKQAPGYRAAFDHLIADTKEFLRSVEPVDAHLGVYSHKTYELILRACTEFESLCKDALISGGLAKPRDKIKALDFPLLEHAAQYQNIAVGFMLWRPEPRVTHPFRGWTTAAPNGSALPWYARHHMVKHNRSEHFDRASLELLIDALSGLFLVMTNCNVQRTDSTHQVLTQTWNSHEWNYSEFRYFNDQNDLLPFTLRMPK